MLDSDSDHKLGLRGATPAGALLASLDRDGDGRIARSEIPHQYRLAIGRARQRCGRRDSIPTSG